MSPAPRTEPAVAVDYFDGASARPRPARLVARGGRLVVEADGVVRELGDGELQWPERQRHGARTAHLASGGALHCHDPPAWDAFALAVGRRESWVVRAQQNWRATLGAAGVLLALAVAGTLWGLPLAARGVLGFVPESADRAIGEAVLQDVAGRWLRPSRLAPAEQQRIAAAFARAVEGARSAQRRPAYELRFHASRLGPNAFALPGGTIVLTDELVQLVDGREDVIVAVLAHELGHVEHRHGMRQVVQVTLLGTVTAIVIGDFSTLVAAMPALLGQLAYSRDFEREADAYSVQLLRAAGASPAAMIVFFEQLRAWRDSDEGRRHGADFDPGIALASHPADEERIRFFREAAAR